VSIKTQASILKKLNKPPTKKHEMMVALNRLNVGTLEEFSRIKKPHK